MRNEATLWLAKYMDADEFLALCSYLQINPQTIPIRQGEK